MPLQILNDRPFEDASADEDLQPNSTIAPISASQSNAEKRSQYLQTLLTIAQSSEVRSAEMGVSGIPLLQQQAAARLRELAIPHAREEDWRFTDLSGLVQTSLCHPYPHCLLPTRADLLPILLADVPHRLVLVNGIYAPELSSLDRLPPGMTVGNASDLGQSARHLGQLPGSEEVFTTLNTAGFEDVAVISLPQGMTLDEPLHVIFVSTSGTQPSFSQPRCLVVAEARSRLTLVEDYITIGDGCMYGSANGVYFTNAVTEIWLGEEAHLHHSRIQRDSSGSFHIGKTAVHQGRQSHYTNVSLLLGAKLCRHNLDIYHQGEGLETVLQGLALVTGEQVADTHSSILYKYPHCTSEQLYKAIVDGRGRSIFNGRVCVPQAAQWTNAAQLNRNLLLSSKARVDTKPQLEIVADNVKCSHGATVSQLEEDEIFYLQSRGIDRHSARDLLLDAFAREIINKIPVPSLRDTLSRCVACRTIP
jgi:Fe-S cluster assembly protein SufD